MIKAVYRDGRVELLDPVPADWEEGLELEIGLAEGQSPAEDDGWLAELNAAAAKIPQHVHDEIAVALEIQEAESKELARREMERSP
jgi:hypothetical protein